MSAREWLSDILAWVGAAGVTGGVYLHSGTAFALMAAGVFSLVFAALLAMGGWSRTDSGSEG